MKRFVFAARDAAAKLYGQPFFSVSEQTAIREFGAAVRSPGTPDAPNTLHTHAEDFILYELGTFDDETGSFDSHAPRQVARAVELKG